MKVVAISLIVAVSALAQANRKVIPHIAQDEHSSTWIHVVNACSKTVSYEISFESVDGQPEAFSLENNEGVWENIYIAEMAARANHFWAIPKTAPGIVRAGYAVIEDDGGGCVSFDVAYGEEVDKSDLRIAFGFVNEQSSVGVVQPFINSTGCDTGVSVVGSGEQVSIEATDWKGNVLGRSDLGRVHYVVFLVNDEFPRAAGEDGLIKITGGDVASLGFIICNERLVWSRRSYPIPGAGGRTTTGRPGPSGAEYEVVEFATKHLRDDGGAFGVEDEYAFRMVLRNPTQRDLAYELNILFRDRDAFVVKRVYLTGSCNSYDFNCIAETIPVAAGQTIMIEDTFTVLLDDDPSDLTIEPEISVAE